MTDPAITQPTWTYDPTRYQWSHCNGDETLAVVSAELLQRGPAAVLIHLDESERRVFASLWQDVSEP